MSEIIKKVNQFEKPHADQISTMTKNIKNKLGKIYVCISIKHIQFVNGPRWEYSLSYQSSIDASDYAIHDFKTWSDLQDKYLELMGS